MRGKPALTCGAATKSGEPCGKAPSLGSNRCRLHGGETPSYKRTHAVMRAGLGRLVSPVAEDDPEVDPFNGFVMEVRRTLGAIRYYEDKIAATDESAAMWGMTKQVDTGSGEWPGTDTTSEAKPNAWIVAWQREREHLTELHKVWIAAKMDERRWNAMQRSFDEYDEIVTAVVVGLGKDPRDPDTRDVVRRAMAGLRGKGAPALGA